MCRDATAVGRFVGGCDYMMMRSQRSARVDLDGDFRETAAAVDPRRIAWASWGADVAIAGMLPDVSGTHEQRDGEFRMWLWTADSDAFVTWAVDPGQSTVRQRGPRDLWEEPDPAGSRRGARDLHGVGPALHRAGPAASAATP
jgi:hypothetical protein